MWIHNQILDQSQEYSIALEVFLSAEYSRQSTGSQLDLRKKNTVYFRCFIKYTKSALAPQVYLLSFLLLIGKTRASEHSKKHSLENEVRAFARLVLPIEC
jgi:hypothetical protein